MDTALDQRLRPLLDWLKRYFNTHRFLWLLALASFLVAWNRGLDLLYGVFALVLAALAISWFLPWLTLRSVRVTRGQARPARAGGELQLNYRVAADRPSHHLLLHETLPCSVGESPAPIHIPGVSGHLNLSRAHPCDRRGVFTLDQMTLGSAWPFGFVTYTRHVKTPPCRVLVMPRTFPIRALPVLRTDIAAVDGYNQTARPDINSQFAGVREYRFGDSLKHIHWSASARHQELIVREYESHDRPHLLVVIDGQAEANVGRAPWSSFEYALMIAGSLIEYAVERRIGLHLMVGSATPLTLTLPPGARNPDDFLEPLAWPQADGHRPYAALVAEAMERFDSVNGLVTMRNKGQETALPPVDTGHLDIVFDEQSFLTPGNGYRDGWRDHGGGRHTLFVHRNSDLEALFADDP